MNIKEIDIVRLSDEQKKRTLSLGITKFGFYKDEIETNWYEKPFVSESVCLTAYCSIVEFNECYHQWFPKEEPVVKLRMMNTVEAIKFCQKEDVIIVQRLNNGNWQYITLGSRYIQNPVKSTHFYIKGTCLSKKYPLPKVNCETGELVYEY